MRFPMSAVDKLIKEALAEDVGDGDLTTESLFPGKVKARGKLIANEEGVLAGLPIFKRVFELVDKSISFEPRATDGMALEIGRASCRERVEMWVVCVSFKKEVKVGVSELM